MSEGPLPLPPLEQPTESFGGADEESPSESEKNVVAPEHVLVREPSVPINLSVKALREAFSVSPRQTSALININELPEDLAATLRPFDINNDGQISLTELIHGAMAHREERKKVVYFRRLVLGFILVWILTMGAFTGLVFGVIEFTKDSKVHEGSNGKGGAALVTTDEAHIVQTANSDFFVGADGSAYVREVTSQGYEVIEGSSSGEDAQYNVMKTSAAQANITFSSYIPDEVLMEMKTISIRSAAGAHLSLQVHGVLRMPAEGYATIGAVTLLTHIGRIVIDGTAVSFYDDTDVAIFESAGFMVNGATVGGRRLLDGILALFGIFNAVAALKDWKGEDSRYARIAPPRLPDNFIMHSRRYAPCVAHPNADGTVVPYPDYLGGTLPSESGVDYCDLLNIDDKYLATTYVNGTVLQRFIETQYVIYRFGSEYLRVEYVHPLHPNVTFVEVLDNSDVGNPIQFHYNVDSHTKGLSHVAVSKELEIVEFKGPIYYYNSSNVAAQNLVDQALSAPFDFLGTTMHHDKEVRIWAMHLMDNTVHAYWYDSVDTQQVQRIDYGNFGMLDVVGLTPINDTDAAAMSFLFTQPIANLTEIVTGASDYLPHQVGINPYDPFVTEYSNLLAAQSFDSNQRMSTKMFTANGEKLLVAPKHLLIPNAEARRRRHIPSSESFPAPRRQVYLNEEEDPLPDMKPIAWEPELSVEVMDLLERSAVEMQEQAEAEAAPVVRVLPPAILSRDSKELQGTDRTCPTGWIPFGNICYNFYPASFRNSWDTCSSLCKETPGAKMLCIESAAQNEFIKKAAASRGHNVLWLGMQKDPITNNLRWGLTCDSTHYNWYNTAPKVNKYAAFMVNSGTWMDTGPQPYSCACQNAFSAPSTRPTAQPSSTRAPLSRPTAPPTMLHSTVRPTSSPNTLPKDKPQRVISSDIAAISSTIKNSFGCKMDNKCDNYFLWYDSIDAPFFPVLTATGNFMFPCVFSSSVEVPVIVPPMPVIEFAIEAGAEIAYCNDFSALDYVYGYMSVSVGITGLADVPVPFGQLFSWQVANVGIGLSLYVSELWCSITDGKATYSNNEAYGLFRKIAQTAKGPQICRCLERGQTYPGIMQVIGGPDIPGVIFSSFPPFTMLSPFLVFMRITNSALIDNFPDVCSLSISRTGMTIDLVIDLAFYSYSVNVFSYQMSTATKSGSSDFIGAYMNKPKGLDAFLDPKGFSNQFLEGPFNKAGNKMKDLLDASAMVWIKVVELGGELANSAKNYFNKGVEEGKILASAAGDLYRLFKPPKVIVYGCFDPHISKPECTKKIKVFGKRICVNYSMPKIYCGSTSKCVKYC